MRCCYAEALYKADGATLDDLREAVTTLEDAGRISRRVMGGAHPMTVGIEDELQDARAALNAELRAAFKEDPSSLSADDRARRAAPSARREESCHEGGAPRFKRDAVAGDRLKSKFQG